MEKIFVGKVGKYVPVMKIIVGEVGQYVPLVKIFLVMVGEHVPTSKTFLGYLESLFQRLLIKITLKFISGCNQLTAGSLLNEAKACLYIVSIAVD